MYNYMEICVIPLQKLLTFFNKKNTGIYQILTLEILMKHLLTRSLILNSRALSFRISVNRDPAFLCRIKSHVEFKSSNFWIICHSGLIFPQVDGAMIDGVQLRVSMARRQPSFEQPTDASTTSWAQIGKT